MKSVVVILLLILTSPNGNAQLGYDIAPKLTSYKMNRFQLEQRFHFENVLSVVMSFSCNKEKTPKLPHYYYEDYGTEYLILNHFVVNMQQIKIGLERNIVKDKFGSRIYFGASIGYNYAKQKHYEALAPLSYEFNHVTDEFDLVYKMPRLRSNMEYIGTERLRNVVYDGYVGTDLELIEQVALTFNIHVYVNYLLSDFSSLAPRSFSVETNIGLRFRIFGDY